MTTAAGAELAPDEVVRLAGALHRRGIRSVKLTGGDPALYGHLEEVVSRLRYEVGYEQVEVISRHPAIGDRAEALQKAGITLFNLSLDTLEPTLHHELCGIDDHAEVLAALGMCIQTGVPTKVNMVVMRSINEAQVDPLIEYCERTGVHTVKLLDVIRDLGNGHESFSRRLAVQRHLRVSDLYVPLGDISARYAGIGSAKQPLLQGGLGHPMTQIVLPSGMRLLIKDSNAGAWYGSPCKGCNFYPCHDALMALRITSDARIQFCLLREDNLLDVSPAGEGSAETLERSIDDALTVYDTASFVPGKEGVTGERQRPAHRSQLALNAEAQA